MEVPQARIAELRRKLEARRGMAGFARNCAAIEQEIARLEAQGGDGAAAQP